MTPKEYLEIALGGNYNISTLTLSAWEDMLESYAKIRIKESKQPDLLQFAYDVIDPTKKVPEIKSVLDLIKSAEAS